MNAVHFGAGNIGRGFIGQLLYQSGFNTCFIDVNSRLVDLLNEKKQYLVELADVTHEELLVQNVHAINSATNPDLVIDAIVKADIVTASVGPNVLQHIAGILAKGLKKRLEQSGELLTIIACENMIGGSAFLKGKVYEQLMEEEKPQFDAYFSFPNAAVDRIVPNQITEDKLAVTVEAYYEWIVDESEIKGDNPPVKGITFVQNLQPYIERKLFTVNTGHAVISYSGYLEGILPMHEALSNNKIRERLINVLEETSRYLVERYSFDKEAHSDYVEEIINRFANPFILDDTTRVGRSPVRKLMSNDRLVSPASKYVEMFGEVPVNLAMAIASALSYDNLDDPEAKHMQETINQFGIKYAIVKFTGLKSNTALFKTIYNHYLEIN